MAEGGAAPCHGMDAFQRWRVSAHFSSACEGLADFRGEDLFQAERPGYERNIWASGQSHSQGVLDTCSASGSPWQRCLQEIAVGWSRSRQAPRGAREHGLHRAEVISFASWSPGGSGVRVVLWTGTRPSTSCSLPCPVQTVRVRHCHLTGEQDAHTPDSWRAFSSSGEAVTAES